MNAAVGDPLADGVFGKQVAGLEHGDTFSFRQTDMPEKQLTKSCGKGEAVAPYFG
jgi:hypothetical protein